jgi:hypothetical protein
MLCFFKKQKKTIKIFVYNKKSIYFCTLKKRERIRNQILNGCNGAKT